MQVTDTDQNASIASTLHDAVQRTHKALAQSYGHHGFTAPSDPLQSLIRTILSQNTTRHNSELAYQRLVARFPRSEELAAATVTQIADAIRPGGLANQKAERIKSILTQLVTQHGSPSLDALADMDTTEAETYLQHFPGVGPKTAACVLMFALGREVFPVDTHVRRITERLGWVPPKLSDEAIHQALARLVPPQLRYQLHVNMVTHGRQICLARKPRCPLCPIRGLCDYYAENSSD
jgi:endonuclease-3